MQRFGICLVCRGFLFVECQFECLINMKMMTLPQSKRFSGAIDLRSVDVRGELVELFPDNRILFSEQGRSGSGSAGGGRPGELHALLATTDSGVVLGNRYGKAGRVIVASGAVKVSGKVLSLRYTSFLLHSFALNTFFTNTIYCQVC